MLTKQTQLFDDAFLLIAKRQLKVNMHYGLACQSRNETLKQHHKVSTLIRLVSNSSTHRHTFAPPLYVTFLCLVPKWEVAIRVHCSKEMKIKFYVNSET